LAMTRWEVVWAGWFVPVFGCLPQGCHCEPVRAWQSSLMRNAGCPPVDAVVALRYRWIAASG
ncbi:MAG: hypothetical protein VCA18_07990, partial [Opitutales bacterium]